MIFDVESMKKAMVEFEVRERIYVLLLMSLIVAASFTHFRSSLQIDLQKMPLGKLSKRQIQSAYALLTEVHQVGNQQSDQH